MRVGFALGSNLGDRLEHLRFGRRELCDRLEDANPLCASIYETQPVGCPPGSATFFNTVIELHTELSPEQLLMITQSIEAAAGRVPSETTNAPRELDIDILYMGADTVETAVLKI
ncbi:MAG: 2-amino-4-hydroxy-6-hydroxymethyldihydropteridine diphosphokinase, partial [Verrucomicrobiota bacterium]